MSRKMVLIVSAVATVTGAAGCSTRPPRLDAPPAVATGAVDSARRIIQQLVATQNIPGFAVTVSAGDSVLWHEGFGLATPATRFRVGSVSKLITATALMRLAQTPHLDLDRPVGEWLDLPPAVRGITLRQLAGHQGGIRHYRGREFVSNEPYPTLRDALVVFRDDSLIAVPGTRYAYSSYGYTLIGAVLEAALGTPFPEIIRRQVLEPLGMDSTAPDSALSGRWPSGGYLSSTDDLARLGRSVLAPGLLREESLATLLTPQRLSSGTPTSIGIGWRISTDSAGRRYVHHGGSSIGGRAFLLVYPEQRLVVAMAANAFTDWGEREALAIAQLFF